MNYHRSSSPCFTSVSFIAAGFALAFLTMASAAVQGAPRNDSSGKTCEVPPGAEALGYTKCVINEHPTSEDIAPGNNGKFKWFRGAAWTQNVPDASSFSTENGMLVLHYTGKSQTQLVGTPRDFSEGALPTLDGAKGFYIEFDVRLSSNDPDHWPAVWVMPVEHSGGSSAGIRDVYPGDPAGYERWMELDVDEGGFRPGAMGSVIAWEGIWQKPGFKSVICNSWGSAISSQPLDRTVVHTFGASWDPDRAQVRWWLDGVNYFTVDNSIKAGCISSVAKKQHFYPIISIEARTAKVPYDMYVSGVRAFVPPQ